MKDSTILIIAGVAVGIVVLYPTLKKVSQTGATLGSATTDVAGSIQDVTGSVKEVTASGRSLVSGIINNPLSLVGNNFLGQGSSVWTQVSDSFRRLKA